MPAERGVVEAELGRTISYSVEQVRAEEQRIVGVEAAAHARRRAAPAAGAPRSTAPPTAARSRSGTRRGTRASRRAGAPAPGPRSRARRAGCGRRRARRARRCTDSGPASSPAWGTHSRPASRAIANASANGSGGQPVSSLARPKPTTPRPAYFDGEVRLVDGVGRIDRAVGGDDDPHADAELARRGGGRVEHDLERRFGRTEAFVVVWEVDRGLDPHRTVDRGVLDDLADEPLRCASGVESARAHAATYMPRERGEVPESP